MRFISTCQLRQGFAALTLAMVMVQPWFAAHADAPVSVAEQLESWLNSVQTLSGDFRQQLFDVNGNVVSVSEGRMSIKRPGRFSWHYQTPSELLVVSDGEQVHSYDVELDHVTVMQQSTALSGSPAALLAGTGSIAENFSTGASWRVEETDWIELRPLDEESDFQILRLAMREAQLAGMELHDQLGQITRVEFSGLLQNEPVPDKHFEFEIPDGVDVIKGGMRAQ